jgi:hypothetical protein
VNPIPRLTTTAPIDRLDRALAILRRVPVLIGGSVVGRSAEDDVLEISCVDAEGHALIRRFDDADQHRSVLNVSIDGLPALQAIRTLRLGSRGPTRCSATCISEFATGLADALTGAVAREEGTPPPRDDVAIARSFDLLRAAVEISGIGDDDTALVIRPGSIAERVHVYVTSRAGSWDASPTFAAMLAPLCLQSDEAYLCGLTSTWNRGPLATCSGHYLRLERPEQLGMTWERDPVTTLRIASELPEGPLLIETPPF